jgi:hypothetical protein
MLISFLDTFYLRFRGGSLLSPFLSSTGKIYSVSKISLLTESLNLMNSVMTLITLSLNVFIRFKIFIFSHPPPAPSISFNIHFIYCLFTLPPCITAFCLCRPFSCRDVLQIKRGCLRAPVDGYFRLRCLKVT